MHKDPIPFSEWAILNLVDIYLLKNKNNSPGVKLWGNIGSIA